MSHTRSFHPHFPHLRGLRHLPVLALVALLPACQENRQPESPALAQQTVPPSFQAQRQRVVHAVKLPASAGRLSPAQRQDFDTFLAQAAAGNPQAVHLFLVTADLHGAELLRREAIDRGMDPVKVVTRDPAATRMPAGIPRPAPGWLTVVADRYVAVPPACPRLSHIEEIGPDNDMSSNFGCAEVSVFQAQVVDPRDLVLGESGGETDSQLTSAAIERMRNDKLKPLTGNGDFTPNSGTDSNQGGGSGSGSSGGGTAGSSTGSGS